MKTQLYLNCVIQLAAKSMYALYLEIVRLRSPFFFEILKFQCLNFDKIEAGMFTITAISFETTATTSAFYLERPPCGLCHFKNNFLVKQNTKAWFPYRRKRRGRVPAEVGDAASKGASQISDEVMLWV